MAKEILVRIAGDASSLKSELGDADSALGGFGKSAGKWAKAGGVALLGLGAGAAALAPEILSTGAQLEALANKSATVFEGSLGDVQAWADVNAGALGMTSKELTGVAAGFADLLKPMGFTADQAADMSKQTLDLAGALSAWTGGTQSAAEVSDVLAKAMLGERDGLKALGISISEADVSARLAAKGQTELTGAALEQAKAVATQELILEKSTDAQKAWADGSMDAIKAQNESKASIAGLNETLVTALYPALQGLIPYVTQAVSWIGEHLPAAIEFVKGVVSTAVEYVQAAWPTISATFQSVFEWIQINVLPIVQGIADFVTSIVMTVVTFVQEHWAGISQTIAAVFDVVRWTIENVFLPAINLVVDIVTAAVPVVAAILEGIVTAITFVVDGVKWAIDNVFAPAFSFATAAVQIASDIIGPIVGGIGSAIGLVWDAVKLAIDEVFVPAWELVSTTVQGAYDLIEPVITSIGDLFTGMADIASGAFEGVVGALKSAWNGIANLWNSGPGAVSFSVDIPGLGSYGFDVPDLPVLHTGGIVPGPLGSEVPILAEAGEGVFTREQMQAMGRSGNTYNITVTDGRSIYSELRLIDALYGAAA